MIEDIVKSKRLPRVMGGWLLWPGELIEEATLLENKGKPALTFQKIVVCHGWADVGGKQ